MGNIAIINAVNLPPLALEAVFDGKSALERSINWARSIPDYSGLVFLADSLTENNQLNLPPESDNEYRLVIRRSKWNASILVEALIEAVEAVKESGIQSPGALFYAWGDSPLIDSQISETLWKLHYRYDAEYTFADGYPLGLTPEILSPALPEKLKKLSIGIDPQVQRSTLFNILSKDINAFDVETHLSPEDCRMDRVSITCDTRRNTSIAQRLYAAGGSDADSLCRLIPSNRHLLRDLPAYFPIQITDHCPQSCSYCPFPLINGDPRKGQSHMDPIQFSSLCRRIADFASDAVISPSLWGEPASHPQIAAMIRDVLTQNSPGIRMLVETSGIGWKADDLHSLARDFSDGSLMWIISLDASDPGIYKTLRGEGMEEAEETAILLKKLFGRFCWVQAVRMNENEDNLDHFFNKWKDDNEGIIIQKHDSFGGYLENRQPADLSPLDRFPCWHLKRDMAILLDGSVPTCRTDLGRRETLGNAFNEELKTLWQRAESLHDAHVRGEYPGPCAHCDEYYTFNF